MSLHENARQSPHGDPLEHAPLASIPVPSAGGRWRKALAFAGPGFLVSVGYMDPGNWATDLAGGARYGYALLSVILLSNLIAILLQHLCVKLGVATGHNLAQACRAHYSRPVSFVLWLLCEAAIAACDLAELVGSAIGLQLLFGIPLVWGCLLTAANALLLLLLQRRGFRAIEALVLSLILLIGTCFAAELWFAKPSLTAVLAGMIPSTAIFHDREMLLVAAGILGATVMPHNLYLHSALIQTRAFQRDPAGRAQAIRYGTADSTLALMLALFINAGILVLSAAAFHFTGHQDVAEIQQAHQLLSPVLGVGVASTLFAVALLASGQSSTLTGTLAGQIVMEGFLQLRIAPWKRQLLTRLLAIVPAVAVIGIFGESRTTDLLVWSQVVLSLQLSFAVVPLLQFTGDRQKMGQFANPVWIQILAWISAAVIIALNLKLLVDFVVP